MVCEHHDHPTQDYEIHDPLMILLAVLLSMIGVLVHYQLGVILLVFFLLAHADGLLMLLMVGCAATLSTYVILCASYHPHNAVQDLMHSLTIAIQAYAWSLLLS